MGKGTIMALEWAQLIVTALAALLATGWAMLRYSREQKKNRDAERRKDFAVLVYPFLRACEELQSRIYNILERGGLGPLRAQDPENLSYAEETLYLIAQYFGWERAFRRSPYAQDPRILRITEAIRITFATDRGGRGAFCFFRGDQRTLAEGMLGESPGPVGSTFDTIPLSQFKKKLGSPEKVPPATEPTLEALRNAKSVSELEGRHRLAEVQNHLVDLLDLIEGFEGFTLFTGRRKKAKQYADWIALTESERWSTSPDDQAQAAP